MQTHCSPGDAVVQFLSPQSEDDDDDGGTATGSDETLQILHSEYSRATVYQQNLLKFIYQIVGIAFPGFTAVAVLLAEKRNTLPDVIYWLAPLGFALLYSLVLLIFFMIGFSTYYVRSLEDELSRRTDVEILHFDSALAKAFFSYRSGNASSFVLYGVILAIVTALYLALVAIGFQALSRRHGDELVTLYLVTNAVVAGTLLWILVRSQSVVRPLFDRYIRTPNVDVDRRSFASTLSFFLYIVMPRPLDGIVKSTGIFIPFFVTMFILQRSLDWEIIKRILFVYLVIDILAKQATYIWNDILDWDRDRQHPYKRQRPLASLPSHTPGIWAFLARALLSIIVAVWVGLSFDYVWLPALVGVIFVYQYIYDHHGKRKWARKLFTVALGYTMRSVAGCLVALGPSAEFTRENVALIGLLTGWIVIYTLGLMAVYYGAEVRYVSLDRRLRRAWESIQSPVKGQGGRASTPESSDDLMHSLAANAPVISTLTYLALLPIGFAIVANFGDYSRAEIARWWIPAFVVGGAAVGLCMATLSPSTRLLWTVAPLVLFGLLLIFSPTRDGRWFALFVLGPLVVTGQSYKATFEEIAWISARAIARQSSRGLYYQLFRWNQEDNREKARPLIERLKTLSETGSLVELVNIIRGNPPPDGTSSVGRNVDFRVTGRRDRVTLTQEECKSLLEAWASCAKVTEFHEPQPGGGFGGSNWVAFRWRISVLLSDAADGADGDAAEIELSGSAFGRLSVHAAGRDHLSDIQLWLDSFRELRDAPKRGVSDEAPVSGALAEASSSPF